MKGDLHILIDFYPKWPDKSSFIAEGFRETGRISYASTPVMERQYLMRVKLKPGVQHENAFQEITKDCNSFAGVPICV
jgi:hypothetical protein